MAGRFADQLKRMRLLFVEDPDHARIRKYFLKDGHRDVEHAASIERAVEMIQEGRATSRPHNLVLVDLSLFGGADLDTMEKFRDDGSVPMIAVMDTVSDTQRQQMHSIGYADCVSLSGSIQVLLARAQLVLLRGYLSRESRKGSRQSQRLFLNLLQVMAKVMEAKDPYTKFHSENVARYAYKIARLMDYTAEALENIAMAGILHDFGKIGVQEQILNKPGPLTEEEFDLVRRHPLIASTILEPIEQLQYVIQDIRHHHEWYDGSGYPSGLAGDAIPLGARILAVAEAYDTMVSARAYRDPMTPGDAREELQRCAGLQFDPEIVGVFLEMLETEDPEGRDDRPRTSGIRPGVGEASIIDALLARRGGRTPSGSTPIVEERGQ